MNTREILARISKCDRRPAGRPGARRDAGAPRTVRAQAGFGGRESPGGGHANGARWASPTFAGLAAVVLLGFTGCSILPPAQPDLTRFYVLTSAAPASEAAPATGQPTRIFLRTVQVPEFLRGKLMPVRVAGNELRYIDEAQWAEPLEAGLTRAVGDDLARRSTAGWVAVRRGDAHDFDVSIQLRHCEGVLPAGTARLAAHIEIFPTGLDPKPVAQDDFETEVAGWDGKDYGQLAKKLSEAADALAGRVAARLSAEHP